MKLEKSFAILTAESTNMKSWFSQIFPPLATCDLGNMTYSNPNITRGTLAKS